MHRREFIALVSAAPLAALPGRAHAGSPEVFQTMNVAIHGYDPVAYFTAGAPVQGVQDHRLRWHGAIWYFSSSGNMALFETDPYRFAPRYGGYCAYAMAQGAVATTVPEAWTVHRDHLYLNFSTGVRSLWKMDIPGNIRAADGHWPAALRTG